MSAAEQIHNGETDSIDTELEDETVELSKDDLFHILQNQRRRRVLQFIQDYEVGERIDMRDIAEQVAAWEHDTTLQQLTSDERQRVYIALYQSHLPKLDEKGVIEYNQSRGIVERTPLADEFDLYLGVDDDDSDVESLDEGEAQTAGSSTSYYGGATALGLTLTAASWVGFAPMAATSYLATFITGMFAIITLGLKYQQYTAPA